MKVLLLIYFACLILVPLVLAGVRSEVRRQARAVVLRGVPEHARTNIWLSHNEWKGAVRDNGKEIVYNSVYYDVINVEEIQGALLVCCVRDDAETNIGRAISIVTDRRMQSDARVPLLMAPLLVFAGAEHSRATHQTPHCGAHTSSYTNRTALVVPSIPSQTATPPPRS